MQPLSLHSNLQSMLKKSISLTSRSKTFLTYSALLSAGLVVGTSTLVQPVVAAGVVGNGTPGSCTEAALNTALADGGNVYFNCGASPLTLTLTSEKVISVNTMIDGMTNGQALITLSGDGKNRLFKTTDGGVQFTVKNLTLANGLSSDSGGAIFSGYRGELTVVNSKFNNNISTKAGAFDGGGAIFSKSESTVVVDKSTFTRNTAANGGAIYSLLSNLTVTNSTFTDNKSVVTGSGGGGGAIYNDGANGDNGKIIVRGNTFTNNTAIFQGGAIFSQLYNQEASTIDKNTFSGNSVTGTGNQGFGGAIFNVGGTLSGLIGFTEGANNTVMTVSNSTFSDNTASNQGAGLWNGNGATVNITNSTFFGNRAVGADGKNGLGGGIMRTGGKMNITNSTIAGNYAGFQGGGIVGGTDTKITNVILANNVANNNGNDWNIKNNCFDQMTNGGNNLQFPAKNPNDPSDRDCAAGILTADPKLSPLANNGLLTQTIGLLTGSPAINAGNNATCPTTDQRGVTRPQGGVCDIGAFEVQ